MEPNTTSIASGLERVKARIEAIAKKTGRPPESITLLAASKTNPPECLREAFAAGQRIFGENFAWVHSIDRKKIADRLSKDRPESLPPLQVCLQVNVSGEDSKSGVAPEEAADLAAHVIELPRLKLRGVMAIPELTKATALQRSQFRMLKDVYDQLKQAGYDLDTVSMGMSEDMDLAIEEGATLVRVGTAIFGPRRYPIPEELAAQAAKAMQAAQ
jgi:uncharacterized pyridoxal phosphate-containing UPF0001 family protein